MVRLFLTLLVAGWGVYRFISYIPDSQLHIIFCDVGQGDATLIRLESVQVLIDGGRDDSVMTCLQQHVPPWDRVLELVIATHPDADHITGLVPVLENYIVGTLLHNGQTKETADFSRFKVAVQNQANHGSVVMLAQSGMRAKIGNNAYLSILFPFKSPTPGGAPNPNEPETVLSDVERQFAVTTDNYNDASIVLKLEYGVLDVLLMADLEEGGEAALIEQGLITEVEVLKVGHHGSKTSSTRRFIDLSRPEISIISAGKNNSYGHPHPLVIERLSQVESIILRTDLESTIELVSNGSVLLRKTKHVWFK